MKSIYLIIAISAKSQKIKNEFFNQNYYNNHLFNNNFKYNILYF